MLPSFFIACLAFVGYVFSKTSLDCEFMGGYIFERIYEGEKKKVCFVQNPYTYVSWSNCLSKCQEIESTAELASIHSDEEFNFIADWPLGDSYSKNSWIGLKVLNGGVCSNGCPPCSGSEPQMEWSDGLNTTYLDQWDITYPFSMSCSAGKMYGYMTKLPTAIYTGTGTEATTECLCEWEIMDDFECFGYFSNDTKVCNGNGRCIGPDDCKCYASSSGPQCLHKLINCDGTNTVFFSDTGKCFTYISTTVDYWAANNYCVDNAKGISGRSACPRSQEEWDGTVGTLPMANVWSGLKRAIGYRTGCPPSTPFTCADGEPIGDFLMNIGTSPPSPYYDGYNSQWRDYASIQNDAEFDMRRNRVVSYKIFCESYIPECDGIRAYTSSKQREGCHNNGICVKDNFCICDNYIDFFGDLCFGTCKYSCNNGYCMDGEYCICHQNYFGEYCNISTCNGVFSNDTEKEEVFLRKFCSDHGICNGFDSCGCEGNYFGRFCNITSCFGVLSNDSSSVCSGKGVCNSVHNNDNVTENHTGKCDCEKNYFGEDCNVTMCIGYMSNDSRSSDQKCNGFGRCWPYESCTCVNGYFGEVCNITKCNNVFSNDTVKVCTNHGYCDYRDQKCYCDEFYFGMDCSVTTCHGNFSNETSIVCSGHGDCFSKDVCSCFKYYSGKKCQKFSCFNVSYDDHGVVCSNHGVCIDHDTCECFLNYNLSKKCDRWMCYDEMNNETEKVCSGHGKCIQFENCNCSKAYPGSKCHEWSCDGTGHDLPDTCFGNGICVDWETCLCYPGYSTEAKYCVDWYCAGVHRSSPKACYRRGTCLSPDKCSCVDDYEGNDCETWRCNRIDQAAFGSVCSGNGVCEKPNQCKCSRGYSGEDCETDLTLVVGLSVSIPIVTTIIGFSVCCGILILVCVFTIAFLSFFVFFVTSVIGLCSFLMIQKKRLKKFQKLKNFDLLLKEQEIESQNDDVAKLKINQSLFEIEYDEVKIVKILGEGGSESTVYKSRWNKQTVAFKCFKTRTLCSSQTQFEEFELEVAILSSISHPNIIRFFGCTLKPPRIGIVMEFCENGDLQEFLFGIYPQRVKQEGAIGSTDDIEYPWEGKMRLLMEISLAMEYIHSRNIIHRDLKLENVLVDGQEHCKLMDFGLSKMVNRMSKTAKTQRIGTSIYIAPEVILNSKYNEKCDVFSFSIMMFVIVTGNRDPYGTDETCVELKVAQDPNYRPNVRELDKYLDTKPETKWLKQIISSNWNHDPNRRLSFKQIGEFLFRFQSGLGNEEEEEENVNGLFVGGSSGEKDDAEKEIEVLEEVKRSVKQKKSVTYDELQRKLGNESERKDLMSYIQQLLIENHSLNERMKDVMEMNRKLEESNKKMSRKLKENDESEEDEEDSEESEESSDEFEDF